MLYLAYKATLYRLGYVMNLLVIQDSVTSHRYVADDRCYFGPRHQFQNWLYEMPSYSDGHLNNESVCLRDKQVCHLSISLIHRLSAIQHTTVMSTSLSPSTTRAECQAGNDDMDRGVERCPLYL